VANKSAISPFLGGDDDDVTCNVKIFDTGWRRLIGCLKLQVIFRKRATNYRALLREKTYKDKASCDSTPPCTDTYNAEIFDRQLFDMDDSNDEMFRIEIFDTGWRRLIGSPKLQIIFHKRATKCRALLRKMTYSDKVSYESSRPCMDDYDVERYSI